MIIGFHLFILSNVPMGVPLEWNVLMIYGALVLFGVHADVGVSTISSPLLWAWLVSFHLLLPLYGSLYPRHVSFLLAMRYYAGNWAYNIWLFRGESAKKLDRLTKWSPMVEDQLGLVYDTWTIRALLSKVVAFRAMHLQGRVVRDVLPRACDDLEERTWYDGEVIAGLVVGWNFGEGHLSNHELLEAVQAQCGFEPGELRCICVEPQPIHRQEVAWRLYDAATGELERGTTSIGRLREGQTWEVADPVR